jgi:crotonobetainyl-CoA:carnitine CoA-transferase CaiB-like acyl-CoA transferase
VTGISTALAVVTALYERCSSGKGQEIDLAIIEPLLTILEPQIVTQDQLGRTLQRTGNQAEMNAPRGLYRTEDDAWVAVSASTVSTATRVMGLVGEAGTSPVRLVRLRQRTAGPRVRDRRRDRALVRGEEGGRCGRRVPRGRRPGRPRLHRRRHPGRPAVRRHRNHRHLRK